MGQYIPHETKHSEAGRWGRSMWKWHIVAWEVAGDGSPVDGGSLCDAYVQPPYLDTPPLSAVSVCIECQKLAGVAPADRLRGRRR